MSNGNYEGRRQAVAQELYTAWLALNRIYDPKSQAEWHPQLGFVGVPSDDRAKTQGRAYDVMPQALILEINRRAAGLPPVDVLLVKQLMEAGGENSNPIP